MILSRTLTAALALALSLYAPFASSQTAAAPSPQPSPGMPKDPAALMQLAEQVNGLTGPGMKPWHIKLSYQTYDSDGKPKDQGTFEEWWAAPDKDKRVYTSPSFNQTEYFTKDDRFRVGDENGPPLAAFLARERMVDPMPSPEEMTGANVRQRENLLPKSKLTCVELARPFEQIPHPGADLALAHESTPGIFPTYCFEQAKPMLRFSGSLGLFYTQYTQIGQLGGRYIGTDLRIQDKEMLFATAHLIEGDLLDTGNNAMFVPPADAISLPREPLVKLDPKFLKRLNTDKTTLHYPAAAKRARIEGKVSLSVVIGEDGRIRQAMVMSAPDPLLATAALVDLSDWTYAPYLLDGHPVAVSTDINFTYRLGG